MTEVVVDSSAFLAVLCGEPDRPHYHDALLGAEPVMSVATRLEVNCVALKRFGEAGVEKVERLLNLYEFRFAPVEEEQMAEAVIALTRFGKGRGKAPAVLNFGDLFSYALAKTRDLPLLFKGRDFAKTDIRPALAKR